MRGGIATAAAAALVLTCAALPARADFSLKNSAYVGYESVPGYTHKILGVFSTTIDASRRLDNGWKVYSTVRLRLRNDQSDLDHKDHNYFDGTFGIDMGALGNLEYTTYTPYNQFPWVNGDWYRRGSLAIEPYIGPAFRHVGDDRIINGVVYDDSSYFQYNNSFGPFDLELRGDPWRHFGPYTSFDEAASFSAQLTYNLDPVWHFSGMRNNLGDFALMVEADIPGTGWKVTADRGYQRANANASERGLTVEYHAPHPGLFDSAWMNYTVSDTGVDSWLASVWIHHGKWKFGAAVDQELNGAIQVKRTINDHMSVLFGWDSGFRTGEGFYYEYAPKTDAVGRGPAYEIGVQYTF